MFGRNKKTTQELDFFSVFDSKGKMYAEPFPDLNAESVKRTFFNAFNDPEAPKKNRYYMNAEDYSIFKIGSFDQSTGQFTPCNLEHVVNLHDLRALVEPRALSST